MKVSQLIPRWLRTTFAWHAAGSTGVWVYLENKVTGQRKAVWRGGGYQPLNTFYMRDGDIVAGYRGTYVIGTESEIRYG